METKNKKSTLIQSLRELSNRRNQCRIYRPGSIQEGSKFKDSNGRIYQCNFDGTLRRVVVE